MRKLFLSLIMLCSIFGLTQAQKSKPIAYPSEKAWLLTNKPQTFLLGFNIGAEYVISKKLSWHTEATNHLHIITSKSTALSTSLKWHFLGNFGKSLYFQPKLFSGFFYDKTLIHDKPYFAGLGLSLGGMHPISKNKRWFLFYEVGFKAPVFFGNRPNSSSPYFFIKVFEAIEFLYFSSASPLDCSIGISFCL